MRYKAAACSSATSKYNYPSYCVQYDIKKITNNQPNSENYMLYKVMNRTFACYKFEGSNYMNPDYSLKSYPQFGIWMTEPITQADS